MKITNVIKTAVLTASAAATLIACPLTDISYNEGRSGGTPPFAGVPDPTLSNDRKVTTPFDDESYAYELVIQNDGKIVAAGTAFGAPFIFSCSPGSSPEKYGAVS